MDLDQAIKYAIDGRAVLFTGAGFSTGARSVRGPMKRGSDLLSHFVTLTGLSTDDGLESVTEAYVEQNGPDALMRELREEFTAIAVTDAQKAIASVPWRSSYTTNYDDVQETASAHSRKMLTSVSLSQTTREIPMGPRDPSLLVHLNGFVRTMTRETVVSEVKLTESSYLTSLDTSPWLALLRQDLAAARAVFFVGYSLYDIDVRRLVIQDEALREKAFFILGHDPKPALVRRAARFGTVVRIDVDEFALAIAAAQQNYKPVDHGPLPYCIKKFTPVPPKQPATDRLIFDLLLYGDVNDSFLWHGLHGGPPYVVARDVAQRTIRMFDDGAKVVALHGGLGNGKTVCLDIVKALATDRGYAVFEVRHHGTTLLDEIQHALGTNGPLVFVVDDYAEWRDFLSLISTRMTGDVHLVLAARSLTHDVQIDRLEEEIFPDLIIREVSVDKIGGDDSAAIVSFLDLYGLWGERAGWALDRKLAFINAGCKGEWHAILLELLEAPQIVERLRELLAEVRPDGPYYGAVITLLIMTILQYAPTVDELVDLCGSQVTDIGFTRNPAVAQIVDFKQGELRIKSAISARYMLQRIADPNAVVEHIVALMRRLDSLGSFRGSAALSTFFFMAQKMMRFANLSLLFASDYGPRAAMRIYESIKDLSICNRHPLFWLQYGIAALAAAERARAGKYFETAYAHAKNIEGYNTYQIDNHYARYLLQEAAAIEEPSQVMSLFRSARKILVRDLVENYRRHYAYRVATEIREIFDVKTALSAKDRNEIRLMAEFVIDKIQKLPEDRRHQRYVEECLKAMRHIVSVKDAETS